MSSVKRWPSWVYVEGEEPDYRFSFANERTFLAWIRTALALLAAGVALDVVDLSLTAGAQRWLAIILVGLGMASAAAAWVRWALCERAMRRMEPLPPLGFGTLFSLITVTSLILVVIGL